MKWVQISICAGLVSISATAAINSASQDILRMAQSGVSEQVMQGYVNNSSASYNLNADDILYLQNNNVPQSVISSMISHDNNIAQGQAPNNSQPPQNFTDNQAPPPDQTAQVNPPDAYANQQATGDQSAQVMQVSPDQAPPQVASFYNALSPYGSWIYLEGSGWCWQPNEVRTASNWQPYCDNGQWLYCDDGWYWQSGYNWGWAPFHYGRWWQASCGWVWFPDTVWAPSWVCWRNTGDYCGWAPLPPSGFRGYGRAGFHFGVGVDVGIGAGLFTFIHFGDMFHGDYRHHEIPRSQATQIYNRTRVINNVTVVNNNYARNPGISRQTVQRYTGTVHVASVRTSTADPRVALPGVERNGSQVSIVRPQQAPAPERTTHIVGHRLPANARSVPTTPIRNNNSPRVNNSQETIRSQRQTTAPSAATEPRNTSAQPRERLQSPKATDTSRAQNQRGAEHQQTTTGSTVTETPRTNPRVTETPRTSPPSRTPNVTQTPHVSETPRPTTPRATDLPRPNPTVKEVPHPSNPRASEIPNPSPRVTEIPHPAPAPAPRVNAEVHQAHPTPSPRIETPREPIHEPAGARTPLEVPHAQSAPHVSAPPAPHVSAPPPHVSAPPQAHEGPPPGQQHRPDH